MKIAAVIAEYNPFHDGHAYQIAQTKELTGADYILVVMSGDFVQRGAPAIYNKYTRTQMALLGGADAVLELPALYATSSAEFFAGGSVTLIDRLGVVSLLSFGSECGSLPLIQKCAELLTAKADEYQAVLSSCLRQGISFPAARYQAVLPFIPAGYLTQESDDIKALFTSPNNILALEYCKALLSLNSSILPFTIKRQGDSYHEMNLHEASFAFPSATAIRNAIENSDRKSIQNSFMNYPSESITCNDFSAFLHYKLLTDRETGFTKYADCSKDLSDKIQKHLPEFTNFTDFCSLLKSKDLTYTRISRILTHILLGITTQDSFRQTFSERQLPVPYARLLGFKRDSVSLLSAIRKNSSIPLLSKLADAKSLLDEDALTMLKQDILVSDIYESAYSSKYKKRLLNEYKQSPIIL